MVKIKIFNLEVTVEILYINRKEKIEIKHGKYKDKDGTYDELVIAEGKILLQSSHDTQVIASSAEVVNIIIKSPIEKLVEHFQDDDIYLGGINAIPEDRTREALAVVLQK